MLNKAMQRKVRTIRLFVWQQYRSIGASMQAALVQLCAALLTLLLASVLMLVMPSKSHAWLAVQHWLPLLILHVILAQALSNLLLMQPWWRWIHAGLPLAIWGMLQLSVPDEIYLLGFLISLSLYWTTYRTQVPFYPSRPATWKLVLAMIPTYSLDARLGKSDNLHHVPRQKIVEIGSGLGGFSHYITAQRPDCDVIGVEVAPLPWLLSVLIGWMRGSRARFHLRSYEKLNFAEYDVIYAYLSPAAMPALWQKVSREMRPGGLLISYEFEIPGVTPAMVLQGNRALYAWRIPATTAIPATKSVSDMYSGNRVAQPRDRHIRGRVSRRFA